MYTYIERERNIFAFAFASRSPFYAQYCILRNIMFQIWENNTLKTRSPSLFVSTGNSSGPHTRSQSRHPPNRQHHTFPASYRKNEKH